MIIPKYGLRALELLLLSLSLMAIVAAGAQAEGKFLVNGSQNLHASATGEVDLLGQLLMAALNFEMDCKKFKVSEGLLLTNGLGHASFLFEECDAYQIKNAKGELTQLKFCGIYETQLDHEKLVNEGNVKADALFLVVLHKFTGGEKAEIIVSPKTGTLFTTIYFHECPIPLTTPIAGALTLELHEGGDKIKHLVREAAPGLRLGGLVFGHNGAPATLDGSGWVFLTGAHQGMTWGIV